MVSEKEMNMVRGKIVVGKATTEEALKFIEYVNKLEELVEEASCEDFYGTEGYKHRLGWG